MLAVPSPRHVALNALFLDPGASGGPETYLRGLVPGARRASSRSSRFTRRHDAPRRARAARRRLDGLRARSSALPVDEGQRARRAARRAGRARRRSPRRRALRRAALARVDRARCAPRHASVVTLHDVTFFRMRTFGARHDARACSASCAARGAQRRRADRRLGGGARRRLRDARHRPARASPSSRTAPGRPPDAAPATPSALRARSALDGRRVVLCVGADAPAQEPGAARRGAAAPARRRRARARRATTSSYAGELERAGRRARRGRPAAHARLRRRRRARGAVARWPPAPRSRRAPRASGCRCSRRCGAACRSRARTSPVLREVGGDVRALLRPRRPGRRGRARSRAAMRRRARAASAGARGPRASPGRPRRAAPTSAYERALA